MITLQSTINRELLPSEADENIRDLAERTQEGWKDLVSKLQSTGVPTANQPTMDVFGPSGLRKEFNFAVGDYLFTQPFHVNHDVKIGGKSLVHVHWSTNGIDTNSVKWEFQMTYAKGHDQEFFNAPVTYIVEGLPNRTVSGAWRHYVTEVPIDEAIIGLEPDTLVLVTLRRLSNGATENMDGVFGMTVDFHYEADRDSTPNRSPNFYV